MDQRLEHILYQDDWNVEDRKRLAQACDDDPMLATQINRWARISRMAGRRFLDELPDSDLMVLFALSESPHADALSPEEIQSSEAVKTRIASSPARDTILLILDRIREDATVFSEAWTEALQPVSVSTFDAPATEDADSKRIRRGVPVADREATPGKRDRPFLRRIFSPAPIVRWGYGIAAMVAIVAVGLVLVRQMDQGQERFTYEAREGQTHIVNLPDGSSVRLINGSKMSHAVGPDGFDRQITLEGQAYFDVANDPVQFTVQTENAVVSVYGTSFGVASNAVESITEVVLVSGSVRMESKGDPSSGVLLEPGQFSRVLGTNAPLVPAGVNLDHALSWTDLFIFRDTRLVDVVQRLSESFEIDIEVAESVAGRTVTGTFAREQGLQSILDAIAAALQVSIEELPDSGGYRISS